MTTKGVDMQGIEALRAMVERSHLSGRAISTAIGRAPTFIGSTLYQSSPPTLDTLAAVARVVGARVVVELEDGTRLDLTDSGESRDGGDDRD